MMTYAIQFEEIGCLYFFAFSTINMLIYEYGVPDLATTTKWLEHKVAWILVVVYKQWKNLYSGVSVIFSPASSILMYK